MKLKTLDIVQCMTQPPRCCRIEKGEMFRVHRSGLGPKADLVELVRIRGGIETFVTAPHPEKGPVAVWADETWFTEA